MTDKLLPASFLRRSLWAPGVIAVDIDEVERAHDAVRADMEMALAKVRRGGVIAIDDYSTGNWWGDDVVRAANGFVGDHAAEVAIGFALAGQVLLVRR